MYGYYDQRSQARTTATRAASVLGAGAVVGAFAYRRELSQLAEHRLAQVASHAGAQAAANTFVESGLKGAEAFQGFLKDTLGKNKGMRHHFRTGEYRMRNDLRAHSEMRARLPRLFYEKQAADSFLSPMVDHGWSDSKIDAFYKETGLVQSLVYARGGDFAEVQRTLQNGAGEFRKHLEADAKASGRTMSEVLRSTADQLRAISSQIPEREKDDDVLKSGLATHLEADLRERLRKEAASGPSWMSTLTGVKANPLSTTEEYAIRSRVGDEALDYSHLQGNFANAQFVGKNGRQYDLSGLRSLAMSTKDFLTDRIQIPLSPFQTGLTFGQMFPFVPRLGDKPASGVYERGYGIGAKLELFSGKKILSYDMATDAVDVSRDDYTFVKANKSFVRNALDAEREHLDAAAHGEQQADVFAQAFKNAKSGLGVEPGGIPYWDVMSSVVRKYTSPDYLPNILRKSAKGQIDSEEEALKLSGVLGQTSVHVKNEQLFSFMSETLDKWIDIGRPTERPLVSSADDVLEFDERNLAMGLGPVRRIDPSVADAIWSVHHSHEPNEFVKWAKVVPDLQNYYSSRSTRDASPKIRKMMGDLEGMQPTDRVRYLSQTASYADSRRAQTLFGLDVTGGAERVTNLDIIRGQLLKDLVSATADSDTPLETLANRMLGRGDHEAALFTNSMILDRKIAVHNLDGFKEFLAAPEQSHLRAHLDKESQKRFSHFHLQPKDPAPTRDFGSRQRIIAMRTSRRETDGIMGANRLWSAYGGKSPITDQDATPGSMFSYFLMDRLHTGFAEVGLGLGAGMRTSAGRMALGMIALRYAPIFLGAPEAHKFINRVTRDVPFLNFLNPDMHRANFLDAVGSATHKGSWRRTALGMLPGLDFYLDDRTEKEEKLHQRTAGPTAVRKGRWWAFGSREAFFGQKVSYYAPSASRIARSDWQNAANVNQNTWESWRHFGGWLNPVNHLDKYWWERSQAKNRPYVVSGPAFDPDHPWSAPLNTTIGKFLKPQKIFHPEVLPRHLGGTLEDQPTQARPTSPFSKEHGYAGSNTDGGAGTASGTGAGNTTKHIPRAKRIRDPRNDALLDRINLARHLSGRERLGRDNEGAMSPEEAAYVRQIGLSSGFDKSLYHLQEVAGLYGWMGGMLRKDVGHPVGRVEVADASRGYGRERRFYDQELGGIGGTVSDILRRFLPHRRRSIQQYDPVRNNQAGWMPGSDYLVDFQHGDPYTKVPLGEMRLPGEAYERLHPGTKARMLRVRASSIGKSQEDIEQFLLRKEGDGSSSMAAELGTKMHRVLQNRWRALGIMEADEVEVFDKELNVTGHIDAILRLPNRRGKYERAIVDIKTKTAERFRNIKRTKTPEDENLDQLLFYMHTTGIKKGLLTYVNRENVNDVFQLEVKWDQKRFNEAVRRMNAARETVTRMVKTGQVSRGELYDPITKFEILSDVAPYSAEFARLQQWASRAEDSLSKEDQMRLQQAKKRLKHLKNGFELHAYRFRPTPLRSAHVKISRFVGRDRFEDTSGQVYKIAGTKARESEHSDDSQEEWWKHHAGLKVGSHVHVILDPEEDKADSGHVRKAAVFAGGRNVGLQLIARGALKENVEDFSGVATVSRFTHAQRAAGRVWEWFAHQNTPFHTKFLPVRSGLEQYERTDVYGKNGGSWDSPVSSYIIPTLVSMTNKNPVAAAAMGAMLGTLFPVYKENRAVMVKAGAILGVALSLFGVVRKAMGSPYIAPAVRKRRKIDAYYDTLIYVKYRRLAAQEEALAQRKEGIDVEELEQSGLRNVAKEQEEHVQGLRATVQAMKKRKEQLTEQIRRRKHDTRGNLRRRIEGHVLSEQIRDNQNEQRSLTREGRYEVGNHTLQALLYRQRYRATIRGAMEGGSWQAALSGLPKTSRNAIVDVIQHGSSEEKEKLYRLLPQDQKALLGYALGIKESKIPHLETLSSFFKHNPLPKEGWDGWKADASLDLIKTRDVVEGHHHLDPMDFGMYPSIVEEATQGSPEAGIPLPSQAGSRRTATDLHRSIYDLVTGHGVRDVRVEVHEEDAGSDSHEAEVEIDVQHRREHAVFSIFKKHH